MVLSKTNNTHIEGKKYQRDGLIAKLSNLSFEDLLSIASGKNFYLMDLT